MTESCEHKNIELLYITFVEDGIDAVRKCKDCGATLVTKGYLTGDANKNEDCDNSKDTKHISMDCKCELSVCSICKKEG